MVLIMRYMVLPDGSIEFIRKGLPPEDVPGYEVDPLNSYLFHPILPPCQARIFKDLGSECCPLSRSMRFCTKFSLYAMRPETCKSCAERGDHVPPGVPPGVPPVGNGTSATGVLTSDDGKTPIN